MSERRTDWRTRTGRQLYDLLPEVYRTRDRDEAEGGGDLAAYLDACGELLDRIRHTLDQRLADAFPDQPAEGRAGQGWILPYFARLLDVRLVSPHLEGRREEVAKAVAWRQRKGTLATVDAITEAVAQTQAEVHEGWKRVAVTPRPGFPLEPALELPRPLDAHNPLDAALELPRPLDAHNPLDAALHPGLPAVTPDLRRCVCLPGTHEDHSRRTVDGRLPSWKQGQYHPRRLVLFTPPPVGFFPPTALRFTWDEREQHGEVFQDVRLEDGGRVLFNPAPPWWNGQRWPDGRAAVITPPLPNFEEPVGIQELSFVGSLIFELAPGERVELRGVAASKVEVRLREATETESETDSETDSDGGGLPVLDTRDCLFGEIEAEEAVAQLEYCTVLGSLAARRVLASDCLFAGEVEIGDQTEDGSSCVRYSRIPPELASPSVTWLRRPATTTEEPAFFDLDFGDPGGVPDSPEFGRPGCGVLHPATPEAICFGAEDGGEMGAYHRERHCLQRAAVVEKLKDFLPVGIDAALVPDPRLLAEPPDETNGTETTTSE